MNISERKLYEPSDKLFACPIDFNDACFFIDKHHRHHVHPQGHKFSIACAKYPKVDWEDVDSSGIPFGLHENQMTVCGVVIVGRPVSRMLQNGWTLEVTRLATDGTSNACSFLYGAAWRAAKAMGYRRMITYILDTESGTTLKAAGWRMIGEAGGGSWNNKKRPRIDKHPLQRKFLFEVSDANGEKR